MAQTVKSLPAMLETQIQSPGWEDSPGEGNGCPLQYSCLENSTEEPGGLQFNSSLLQSWTQLSDRHFQYFGFRSPIIIVSVGGEWIMNFKLYLK